MADRRASVPADRLLTGLAFGSVPTTAQLRETISRYATVISARDADAYAAQFTVDAVQIDPYPTPANVGRDAIRAFIQRSYDACEAMQFEVESIHPVADKAAIEFHITVTLAGGGYMHIRGSEIFTITDEGLISRVEAYWGDDDVEFLEALG
jgi:steroid Delta-isomerase